MPAGPNCSVCAAFRSFYFFFSPTFPLWPLRWKQRGWWNETISLFPCSHFPAAVTLLLLILFISSSVSLDFSHDVVRALIGSKYHKHHHIHLCGERRLHATHYMVHFNCGVSATAADDGDTNKRDTTLKKKASWKGRHHSSICSLRCVIIFSSNFMLVWRYLQTV